VSAHIEGRRAPPTQPNPTLAKALLPDDLSPILSALLYTTESKNVHNSKFLLMLMKLLKILSRKVENRVGIPERSFQALISQLQHVNTKIATEIASVLLNACYEPENVEIVLSNGGGPALTKCLESSDEELQACAAGAIQSITYQVRGRNFFEKSAPNTVAALIRLVSSGNNRVRTRAVGALHNMSTDLGLVALLRNTDGVLPLVKLLEVSGGEAMRSAAGTIMNISRDTVCRQQARDAGVIPLLLKVLFGDDVKAQTSAVGALMNIVGVEVENERSRELFKKVLSLSLALGITYDCMNDYEGNVP